jgi:flagellar motor switch protein FliN/FliY
MTTPSSSYDWVREIKPDLKQLDSIPLTGAAPPFPWEDFSARIASSFDREGIQIQPGEIEWRTKENLYEGLGDSPFPLIISIPSLRGQVSWVMPSQEIPSLAALLLTKESHPLPLHDQAFNESFYHFLALEVLYNFTQVAFDKTLSPVLTNQTALPNEDSLCWNISLQIQNHTAWGRLIISPEFRRSWVEHFAQKQEPSLLTQQMAQLVNVTVHLEAGKTQLNLAEWMAVKLGDFLTLDSCSLDAERLDGRIMLTVNGKSAFRAKLKDGSLKILELPLLHEVETSMAKQPEDEDEFSDLDLPEEEDDDLLEDEDLFSESETEEDDLFSESEEETDTAVSEGEAPAKAAAATSAAPSAEAKSPIAPEQIPVTLVVEVGQVQMTMEQLLKLEPGNLLDINLHPENGVDLTINGKLVGKGELIRIGDVIGVRVLQLGR